MATTAPRLFVSHSHEDDAFCRRLVADLRANLARNSSPCADGIMTAQRI
jgi:hypothetical protein